MKKTLRILGTRGVPASHGGFETFAEQLSLYLVNNGWRVIVYCQVDGEGPIFEDVWQGVERVNIPVAMEGPKGTVVFDWKAIKHASKSRDLCLTLGYNTAVFNLFLRLKGVPNIINMDGIEWKRAKWGRVAKAWLWFNDWAGCWLGNHLVADHPQIEIHLQTRVAANKITKIPYGADSVTAASVEPVLAMGLEPGRYMTVIARPEPENSILEVVQGFSAKPRGYKLVVLGTYHDTNLYHNSVKAAGSAEVLFVNAIYDKTIVQSLRYHSAVYVHGHQAGGTNPSLVEALGAGNAVIAHDNHFNRWVVGEGAIYFTDDNDFSSCLDSLMGNPEKLGELRERSRMRFEEKFTWAAILHRYEVLLTKFLPEEQRVTHADS